MINTRYFFVNILCLLLENIKSSLNLWCYTYDNILSKLTKMKQCFKNKVVKAIKDMPEYIKNNNLQKYM